MKITSIKQLDINSKPICEKCHMKVEYKYPMLRCPYCAAYIVETIVNTAEEATYKEVDV